MTSFRVKSQHPAKSGFAVLTACTAVTQWYMQNGLQLNPDKSRVLMKTPGQLQAAVPTMLSVSVTGVDLLVADEMKGLGVVRDRHLTFDSHATISGKGMQLLPPSHQTHPPVVNWADTQPVVCPGRLVLLQLDYCKCSVIWSSSQQYSEAAMHA